MHSCIKPFNCAHQTQDNAANFKNNLANFKSKEAAPTGMTMAEDAGFDKPKQGTCRIRLALPKNQMRSIG